MISDPILSTLAKLISLHDGIAESSGEHILNVLLTENLAKTLLLPEEVTFSTRVDVPNSSFVTYHSELLDKFSQLLAHRGNLAVLGVKYSGYLKSTGFDKLLSQNLVAQNGLIRFIDAKPKNTRYLWCHVAYTAEADEKRLGMVSFILNEVTKVAPVEIGDALMWESDWLNAQEISSEPGMEKSELSTLLEQTSSYLIKSELENWYAKLARAKARDEERLKAYYGTISAEIQNKIKTKQLEGESRDKELARIEATNRELDRKLTDIKERYHLNVSAFLHSAMILYLPTIHIECELVRKKAKRIVTVIWNPFTKKIEPLRCEVSGLPVYSFYLDDRHAKIISPDYYQSRP